MNTEPLRTCTHIHDTGQRCDSAAARGRDYCVFHFRHRARLMRIAQARARAERFDLKLPAIDSMATVVVAINQLLEAVSADMIDLKRADFLLKGLRFAATALKNSDKWSASPFHSDQPSEVDLARDYGLPNDLNLDAQPEQVFPPLVFSDLSSRPEGASAPAVEGPAFSGDWRPATGDCDADPLDPRYVVRPDTLEIAEIYEKVSPEAATVRMRQLDRNRHRRELTANRKRFEQMAMRLNIRHAAERLAQKKLAERAVQEQTTTKKPPASANENTTEIEGNQLLTPTGSIG